MIGWCLAIALLFLAVLLLLSPITIRIDFKRAHNDDRLIFTLRALYGLLRHQIDIPQIRYKGLFDGLKLKTERVDLDESDLAGKNELHIDLDTLRNIYHRAKVLLAHTNGFNLWFKQLLGYIHCTRMNWVTRIGISEAPETAIASGFVWGIKSSLLTYALNHIKLDSRPEIYVYPQYNRVQFATELLCIVRLRLGNAMIAGLLLLVRIIKVKGGVKTWKNILSKG